MNDRKAYVALAVLAVLMMVPAGMAFGWSGPLMVLAIFGGWALLLARGEW